jgi:hypothetical protein
VAVITLRLKMGKFGVFRSIFAARRGDNKRATKPNYSPVNSGFRFSNVAVMPSVRSFDGNIAAFHTAT